MSINSLLVVRLSKNHLLEGPGTGWFGGALLFVLLVDVHMSGSLFGELADLFNSS